MIEYKLLSQESHLVIISPNPSMPWNQIKKIFSIYVFFILIIAIILTTINLYLAIPFYGIEVALLGYALYITSLKSTYYEEINIDQHEITVTFVNRRKKIIFNYVRQWTRFSYKNSIHNQPSGISIGAGNKKIHIGQNVNEKDRRKLVKILRTIL